MPSARELAWPASSVLPVSIPRLTASITPRVRRSLRLKVPDHHEPAAVRGDLGYVHGERRFAMENCGLFYPASSPPPAPKPGSSAWSSGAHQSRSRGEFGDGMSECRSPCTRIVVMFLPSSARDAAWVAVAAAADQSPGGANRSGSFLAAVGNVVTRMTWHVTPSR